MYICCQGGWKDVSEDSLAGGKRENGLAGQDRTGQDRAGQGRAVQGRTGRQTQTTFNDETRTGWQTQGDYKGSK